MRRTLLAIFVISALFRGSRGLAGPPIIPCSPPVVPTLALAFHGLTSGCTQASTSPPCIVGETVQFQLVSGAITGECFIVYTWIFPEGTVLAASYTPEAQNHQFQNPGTFTATFRMAGGASEFPTITLNQTVHVVRAAAIPTLYRLLEVLLVLVIGLIAIYRLS
jgi:hypothetical protein